MQILENYQIQERDPAQRNLRRSDQLSSINIHLPLVGTYSNYQIL